MMRCGVRYYTRKYGVVMQMKVVETIRRKGSCSASQPQTYISCRAGSVRKLSSQTGGTELKGRLAAPHQPQLLLTGKESSDFGRIAPFFAGQQMRKQESRAAGASLKLMPGDGLLCGCPTSHRGPEHFCSFSTTALLTLLSGAEQLRAPESVGPSPGALTGRTRTTPTTTSLAAARCLTTPGCPDGPKSSGAGGGAHSLGRRSLVRARPHDEHAHPSPPLPPTVLSETCLEPPRVLGVHCRISTSAIVTRKHVTCDVSLPPVTQ
ncbi:hypothetical protein NDU88_004857 [Pleurodeles waltl]|uniref:Uncharacterized protein n=1 Tax=Pleurodeles waltl TaxID=8319 RepID=A0AAV7SK32_PLEWA|nr:hypothetical protein NDU88_004857 [Pleurodeles waltl]